jgi:hypothetical protein
MAAFEVIALDTATPQLRAPGAADTYTFPRAVEMPLGTANGVLYLNGSKVVTSGSALVFDASNRLGIAFTPINTGANGGDLQIGNPNVSSGAGLTIGSTTTADIQFSDAISGTGQYAGLLRYSHVNDSMQFWTASAEQMRLTSTGLGIGTTSIRAKTEVVRSVAPTSVLISNSYIQLGGTESALNSYRLITFGGVGETHAPAFLGYLQTSTTASSLGDLIFGTRDVTTNTAATTRFTIKSNGQVRFVPLAADPGGAENGDVYYNSTTNKLRVYAGGAWVDLH